jgi:hypothetical protein
VAETLVIRMNSPVSPTLVEELNDKYSRILVSGRIEQSAGPVDGEESEYADKARLTMNFNRKSFGILRQLVNDLNRAP